MENTFIPAICIDSKDDNGGVVAAAYRGTVTLRMPNFDERIAFYDNADVSMDTGGLADEALRVRNRNLIRHVSRQAQNHVVRVDITRVADGYKFDSVEALQYDTDMIAVMMEISMKLIGKFSVGAVGNGGSTSSSSTSPPSIADTSDPGAQQAS